jgi:predicted nucleic acid-binding protein
LALLIASDEAHELAVELTTQLQGQIVTTGWVLLEFANAVSKSRHRHYYPSLLDDLKQNPQMTIIAADESLFDEGTELYRLRPDKDWSLTDCISFLVMEREGITDALTGDHHFEQAGFNILFK